MIKKIQLEILCQKGVHHSMKLKDEVAKSILLPLVDSSIVLTASSKTSELEK